MYSIHVHSMTTPMVSAVTGNCVADTMGGAAARRPSTASTPGLDGGGCEVAGVVCDDAGSFYDCDLDCVESYVAHGLG